MSVATAEPSSAEPSEESLNSVEATSLRSVAEHVADMLPEGFRVEILEGSIVVSPTPSTKHNGAISRIHRQLTRQLPDDKDCYQVTSVGNPGENKDYTVPDLVVMPVDDEDDESIVAPNTIAFALEVVSPSNAHMDTHAKPRIYAAMGIPIYLLVDPRDGSLVCYSDPRGGEYYATHKMKFGDVVVLPEPLKDLRIETQVFRIYD